jgi:hypothetical protein
MTRTHVDPGPAPDTQRKPTPRIVSIEKGSIGETLIATARLSDGSTVDCTLDERGRPRELQRVGADMRTIYYTVGLLWNGTEAVDYDGTAGFLPKTAARVARRLVPFAKGLGELTGDASSSAPRT